MPDPMIMCDTERFLEKGVRVRATDGILMYTRYFLRIMIVYAQERRALEAREGHISLT